MDANQTKRVREYEAMAKELEQFLQQVQALLEEWPQAAKKYHTLTKYYDSPQWLQDYDASNEGKLPPPEELPQGILSEDYLYNLFISYRQALSDLWFTSVENSN